MNSNSILYNRNSNEGNSSGRLDASVPLRVLIALLLSIIFTLIILLRSENFDNDFLNYEAVYSGYVKSDFEFGFNYLLDIGRTFSIPITAWLAILAFPGLMIKFAFSARSDGMALAVFTLLFSSSFFLLHELNQARFALAVSFAILAAWLREKHAALAVIVLLLGVPFHYGVLLLLPALMGVVPAISFFAAFAAFQYLVQSTRVGAELLLSVLPAFLSESDRVRGYTVETVSIRSSDFVATISLVFLLFQLGVARIFEKMHFMKDDADSLLIVARRTSIMAIPIFIAFFSSPVLSNRLAEAHRFFLLFYLSPVISRALKGKGADPVIAGLFLVVIIVGNLYVYGNSVLPLYAILDQIGLGRPLTAR